MEPAAVPPPHTIQNATTLVALEGPRPMQHDLVRRAQQGDRDAFGALVHGAIARLYASARLIVRDSELAQDAVQDALVEAWRDIRALRDPDRLDAWLHRLLVRACYRVARNVRGRASAEIPWLSDHDAPIPDESATIDARDQLERAFARIQADHRTVLVLVYYADLSLADAAVALGIPLGTMKSRLSRAMAALRAAVDADARAGLATTERIA
jgi:RNA polymerase sigma-70 factor (ECF subfamily)